jgi:2-keto-4-pentenoate hydratase/2-oxohepta-3-ene-1,7-dioic acid hydratase in catechol pathway
MRLVSYTLNSDTVKTVLVGVELPGDKILNVAGCVGQPRTLTMRQFLECGAPMIQLLKAAMARPENEVYIVDKADVTLEAPIQDPTKVICVGMNYVDHCTEQNAPIPTEPVIFSKFPSSVTGPFADLPFEGIVQTGEFDFEVELVIVVGKEGRAIPKEKAMEHVIGYTVAHDVSARDWQLKRNGGQWLLGKCMDGFAPIGPALVTTDEVGDPHNLGIRCILNGRTVQDSNTKQLVFKTEDIIAWVSRFCTLVPGDMILTGTPPGVGFCRKPPLYLKHGDVVTCEIDGIGAITNKVKQIPVKGPALVARSKL